MDSNEIDIELIEGYLLNSLDEVSKVKVENRLKTDSEFVQLLNEMKILMFGIEQSGKKEIIQQLQELEAHIKKNDLAESHQIKSIRIKETNRKIWAPLAIAASIIVLIGLVWFNNHFSAKVEDPLAVYYEQISPDLIFNSVRNEVIDSLPKHKLASELLHDKKFFEAIPVLEEIIIMIHDTSEMTLRTYSNCLLQISDCKNGIDQFNKVKSILKTDNLKGILTLDQILLIHKCKVSKNSYQQLFDEMMNTYELLDLEKSKREAILKVI